MVGALVILIQIAYVIFVIKKSFNKDARAQRALDRYLRRYLSAEEIGKFYERYIGYLYESKGHDVNYHGALSGYNDMGRDLIVRRRDETLVIQAKCWSKIKLIQEKHIFQIFGTMTHFKLASGKTGGPTRAVFIPRRDIPTSQEMSPEC
ncbi:restriction endonuclease [Bdellovibrio sp. BCCA]|uniref:restriction endonuclease n=1 Tax=Bdellovibrio sp. BCCA TaxID=3136281 RepID=UPI0030F22691